MNKTNGAVELKDALEWLQNEVKIWFIDKDRKKALSKLYRVKYLYSNYTI